MKNISIYIIRETLHPPDLLRLWDSKANPRDIMFLPRDVLGRSHGRGSLPLISTSLFGASDDTLKVPAKITHEWFSENVLAGEKERYFDPLIRRRKFYDSFVEASHRVYIPQNMASLSSWLLEEIGFHEVVVMSVNKASVLPGMLWRYLPIADRRLPWVVCTGVDENGIIDLAPKLAQQHDGLFSASIATERWWLPFAGPASFNPKAASKIVSDIPSAMTGFLDFCKFRAPYNSMAHRTAGKIGRHMRTRFCDAAFLSMAFWNETFVSSDENRLFSTAGRRFNSVEISNLRGLQISKPA